MVSIEEVKKTGPAPSLTVEKKEEQQESLEEETERSGTWIDLMGKDLQMKVLKVDSSDEDAQVACDLGSAVLVDFRGRCGSLDDQDDTSGPIFHDAKDWLVVIGDKDVTPALEMGIRFLRQGEHALVYSHSKYAYGGLGRKHGDYCLVPDASVVYEVHVKQIRDNATALEIAQSKKQMGNDCYQNEWSDGYGKGKALQLYKRAVDSMANVVSMSPNDEEARSILVDCLNNIAAVHLRAREYGRAKEAATQVLLHDPDNVKALSRAARAAMLDPSSSYEESDAAISAAENVAPEDDIEVKKLRGELNRRERDYKKKSKSLYSRMGKGIEIRNENGTDKPGSTNEGENVKETEATDPIRSSQEDQVDWWKFLQPYLIQLLMPFVTYGLYLLAAKMSGKASIDTRLEGAAVQLESEATEFS